MVKTVDAPIHTTIKATLKEKLPKLWKAVRNAFDDAAIYAEELNQRYTPIYRREYYRSYRGWRGGNLRRSFSATVQGPRKTLLELFLEWRAEYASYLEEKGEAGLAHARTPGTTLLFRKVIAEELRGFLATRIAFYLEKNGFNVEEVQVS